MKDHLQSFLGSKLFWSKLARGCFSIDFPLIPLLAFEVTALIVSHLVGSLELAAIGPSHVALPIHGVFSPFARVDLA